jgi:Mor family transcriptional regulator
MKKRDRDLNLVCEWISEGVYRVGEESAIKAVRALCAHFGGLQIYIPRYKLESSRVEEMRGVIVDAVGDADGDKILDMIISCYGGFQHYIPMEKHAFMALITKELDEQHDGTAKSMEDLCRKYRISFVHFYRLKELAKEQRLQMKFNFDP